MKNLWQFMITGESVFLQAHFLCCLPKPISYFITSSLSVCRVKLSCLPLCLPACLSFCLAGWLSDCPQCCLSVWQVWQLFCRLSLRLIHYNVLLSQHILSGASHRNRTIWCEFIRQRSSVFAVSRRRWCSSHPLTAKGQCTEYNAILTCCRCLSWICFSLFCILYFWYPDVRWATLSFLLVKWKIWMYLIYLIAICTDCSTVPIEIMPVLLVLVLELQTSCKGFIFTTIELPACWFVATVF